MTNKEKIRNTLVDIFYDLWQSEATEIIELEDNIILKIFYYSQYMGWIDDLDVTIYENEDEYENDNEFDELSILIPEFTNSKDVDYGEVDDDDFEKLWIVNYQKLWKNNFEELNEAEKKIFNETIDDKVAYIMDYFWVKN